MPLTAGTPGDGLQLFINMPSHLKTTAPRVQHLTNDKIAEQALPGGGKVRVLVGQHGEHTAPIEVRPVSVLAACRRLEC